MQIPLSRLHPQQEAVERMRIAEVEWTKATSDNASAVKADRHTFRGEITITFIVANCDIFIKQPFVDKKKVYIYAIK